MELYQELLLKRLAQEKAEISFPELSMDVSEIVETGCYRVLEKIKAVIGDDSLNDSECFMKIEEIIAVFEAAGSNCGFRHDFG